MIIDMKYFDEKKKSLFRTTIERHFKMCREREVS